MSKASETRRRNAESRARIRRAREETQRIVASGVCPVCGSGLRRNNALSGWWQCEQFGAKGFRKDDNRPECNWQGFTE